jgi:predicted DNA-binding antitoxin AbrB/MazE fold protein
VTDLTRTVEAVYENGVLRPLEPLEDLKEHERVRITIETDEGGHPLADCIGILPDEDAEEMRQIIEQEFEKVDLSEWR